MIRPEPCALAAGGHPVSLPSGETVADIDIAATLTRIPGHGTPLLRPS